MDEKELPYIFIYFIYFVLFTLFIVGGFTCLPLWDFVVICSVVICCVVDGWIDER